MRKDPAGLLERTLARRLRELAEAKGKPLYVVAELAGFSRPALWDILGHRASPTLGSVQRLAAALDVHPLELLQGEPGRPRPAAKAARSGKRARRPKPAGR